MAAFMARVELHGANYQDYVNLHAYMAQEGFSNRIRFGCGPSICAAACRIQSKR